MLIHNDKAICLKHKKSLIKAESVVWYSEIRNRFKDELLSAYFSLFTSALCEFDRPFVLPVIF